MKKIMILIVSVVMLIAGGYFTMEYLKQKEKEEKFWNEQKERVEKYIYNIKDVKSITFTENKISPIGVPHIKGYINNNKELDFIASISTTENFEDKFTRSGKLGKLIKDPEKSVSEIEKEEKKKKQE
ncbi:DUF1433 domain-containing protein [Bacillus mycoides]|uniref:DUF1433 domain-containing protein n=1 Tax=Bacillus mycoides TaxID=1405 RepID=UPI0036E46DF2